MPARRFAAPSAGALVLEVRCRAIEFEPPPFPLRVRFGSHDHGPASPWEMRVQVPRQGAPDVVRWLERHRGLGLRVRASRSKAVRADLVTPSPLWRTLLGDLGLREMEISPEGDARLLLHGERELIRAFARSGEVATSMLLHAPSEETYRQLLTARQMEAIHTAVVKGYYRIPRAVNLQVLAREMDMSPGALSELLRRAEARIIEWYTRGLGEGFSQMPVPAGRGVRKRKAE